MRLTIIAATIASVGLFGGPTVQAREHGGLGRGRAEGARAGRSRPAAQ